MDVDEEEGATVRPKQINNYGVEVDFEVLDDDDREVSACLLLSFTPLLIELLCGCRILAAIVWLITTRVSPS